MKKLIVMLTAVTALLRLTSCGITGEIQPEETEPEIHIATIQAPPEPQSTVKPAPAPVEEEPETQEIPDTPQIIPEEPEQDSGAQVHYDAAFFDKAVFAAVMDTLTASPGMYLINDADGDGATEFLLAISQAENKSQNVLIENMASAGLYYYDATGVANDFFVIDPENGRSLLNENTRNEDGDIISREYFTWTGSSWELVSQLYGNSCYWNYQATTHEAFLANVDAMQGFATEDVFNILISGAPEKVAQEFYEYLSGYFKQVTLPIAADIDGDGTIEQMLVVQNLTKRWGSNLVNLYQQEDCVINSEVLNNVHTTCFVLDTTSSGMTRIRSENFDRKYTFAVSGQRLFAYDDTNTMQTIQYSTENDGAGKHFMSMLW